MTGTNNAINTPYPFNKIVIQTFTASGTYIPTAGMKYCIVECIAGGGGGGGAATTIAGQVSIGGGGGAGSYSKSLFTAATIGASQTVTVGAAGIGVSGAAGTNGSDSSLGTLIISNFGLGGNVGAVGATSSTNKANGGNIGVGDFVVPGENGMLAYSDVLQSEAISGDGGSSVFSYGGLGVIRGFAGAPGNNYGTGGSGANNGPSSAAKAGGDGAPGIVIITEYIWN